MSQRRRIVLKLALTLALLAFLGYRMDLSRFVSILSSASVRLIGLALGVHFAAVFLSIIRWRTILHNFDIQIEFIPLTKITLIGYFFNLFLPSGIGGDFFRAYYLSRRKNRGMSTTLTTTVLERSAGMCALLTIGAFFSTLEWIEIGGVPLLYIFLLVIVGYLAANVTLFHSWTHAALTAFIRRRNLKQWEEKMELVYRGLNALRKNRRSILVAVGVSLVIQFLASLLVWIAARSIDIQAPLRVFLIFVPLINLSVMVPLTINGIGLRESLFYLLFSQIGLPVETAVSLSLVTFFVYVLTAVPGTVIYSLYKKEEHLDEMLAKAETS